MITKTCKVGSYVVELTSEPKDALGLSEEGSRVTATFLQKLFREYPDPGLKSALFKPEDFSYLEIVDPLYQKLGKFAKLLGSDPNKKIANWHVRVKKTIFDGFLVKSVRENEGDQRHGN